MVIVLHGFPCIYLIVILIICFSSINCSFGLFSEFQNLFMSDQFAQTYIIYASTCTIFGVDELLFLKQIVSTMTLGHIKLFLKICINLV